MQGIITALFAAADNPAVTLTAVIVGFIIIALILREAFRKSSSDDNDGEP